ncbi:MAG: NfeD family protein [Phycisphaerales bacterium]
MLTVTSLLAAAAPAAASNGAQGNDLLILWAAILLGASLVLIVVELFVPSGGLIGFLAGAAAIGSLVALYMYDSMWGFAGTGLYMLLFPIVIVTMFKIWANSAYGKRLVLGGDEPSAYDEGGAATASEMSRQARASELAGYVGGDGTTETALRPVGTVRIDGRRIDALAEGGMIEAGVAITVVAAYDNQLKVRPRS